MQAREPHKHAIYPLRGKIKNAVLNRDPTVIANNKVLFELSIILGLSLVDDDISKCKYDHIVSLTDADVDGASISGLLMGFLYTYWPKLFREGRVLRLLTPSYIDVTRKKRIHLYSPPKRIYGHLEYIKGLASLTIEDVQNILKDPKFEQMRADNRADDTIELVLGKSAEKRREWLSE